MYKLNLSDVLLGEDEGVTVLNTIAPKSQPVLQDLTLELQLLLISEDPLPVFDLLFQAQDEALGVDGIGMAPTTRILHKDLDLGGVGLQQRDASVGEDPEIGQGAAAIEELPLAAGLLEGQMMLQARAAQLPPDLLLDFPYGHIRVYDEGQVGVTPLLHSHLDVSCSLQGREERG